MKKTKVLFVIWGIIVIVVIGLLTTLGFMLRNKNSDYEVIENKLLDGAKKYVDYKFLYPEGKEVLKVNSSDIINTEFLDELKVQDDTCTGYVNVYKDGVYKYKVYIKCKNYTTKGYTEK